MCQLRFRVDLYEGGVSFPVVPCTSNPRPNGGPWLLPLWLCPPRKSNSKGGSRELNTDACKGGSVPAIPSRLYFMYFLTHSVPHRCQVSYGFQKSRKRSVMVFWMPQWHAKPKRHSLHANPVTFRLRFFEVVARTMMSNL